MTKRLLARASDRHRAGRDAPRGGGAGRPVDVGGRRGDLQCGADQCAPSSPDLMPSPPASRRRGAVPARLCRLLPRRPLHGLGRQIMVPGGGDLPSGVVQALGGVPDHQRSRIRFVQRVPDHVEPVGVPELPGLEPLVRGQPDGLAALAALDLDAAHAGHRIPIAGLRVRRRQTATERSSGYRPSRYVFSEIAPNSCFWLSDSRPKGVWAARPKMNSERSLPASYHRPRTS